MRSNDIKLAVRHLLKSPGFTCVALLSLAIGIGANTAVFSLVNDVLLRSLPVERPDELVLLRTLEGARGRMSRAGENNGGVDPATGRFVSSSFSLAIFERLREQRSAVADLFAFAPFSQVNVIVNGEPDVTASAQFVSGTYYAGLGITAVRGRMLTPDDDRKGAAPAAVISYRYWQRRFAGDPGAIGAAIQVNRVQTTIVGIAPEGFDGALQAGESPDVSVPLAQYLLFQPDRTARSQPWYWWIRIMGRLAPGATPEQVRASLEPVFQSAAREGWLAGRSTSTQADEQMPDDPALRADPGAQGEVDVRRQFATPLRILMGLVGLVLAAACANVANLLLARGAARAKEIALRLALGASRRRIVGQLLAESLLLAFAGAALGILFAWWGRGLLLTLQPLGSSTLVLDLPLDGRVLAFTIAVTAITALVFGLAPALRATRVDLNAQFHSGARTLGRGSRSRLGHALMIVQIALCLVLLVSTGLFVRTLRNLDSVNAGFNRQNLVLFRIDATSAGYQPQQFAALQSRIQQRLQRAPGVQDVTFSSVALLSRVRQNKRVSISGGLPPPGSAPVNTNGLAPNFFAAMQLPLLLGRGFTLADDESAPRVAVVNQAFVRGYLNGENPIARHIVIGPAAADDVAIVGVAADAKYTELRGQAPPTIYLPAFQRIDGTANYALRIAAPSRGRDAAVATVFAAIRSTVREIDPALPVLNLRTQDEQIDRLHAQERLFARLSGMFGVVALALASVGLYGLLSHAVTRRTGEIGVRMALGAQPGAVLAMIMRESLMLVCCGILLGAAGAYAASRVVRSMLFGLTPGDPLTYGAVALILGAIALVASAIPARRASRIDPITALRQ
jgi:predicted permease